MPGTPNACHHSLPPQLAHRLRRSRAAQWPAPRPRSHLHHGRWSAARWGRWPWSCPACARLSRQGGRLVVGWVGMATDCGERPWRLHGSTCYSAAQARHPPGDACDRQAGDALGEQHGQPALVTGQRPCLAGGRRCPAGLQQPELRQRVAQAGCRASGHQGQAHSRLGQRHGCGGWGRVGAGLSRWRRRSSGGGGRSQAVARLQASVPSVGGLLALLRQPLVRLSCSELLKRADRLRCDRPATWVAAPSSLCWPAIQARHGQLGGGCP